ncbi:serine/threonine-protein kinase, partial [Acidobacteriota bacterium]
MLGHYRLIRLLGRGGMGDVFLALDTELDRRVALKVLRPDYTLTDLRRARFKREARAAAGLNHSGIVTIYAFEEFEGTHVISMEYVSGKALSHVIPPDGFPVDRLVDLGFQITDAVRAAHEAGITHRDLKPANVMLTPG